MARLRTALAACLLALGGCGDDPPAPVAEGSPPVAPRPTRPPPVMPDPISPMGVYRFDSAEVKVTLYLDGDGTFRILSHRKADQEQRSATGRWTLRGQNLMMSYETMNGDPIEEADATVNRIEADGRILLKSGESEYRLVKQKVFDVR